MLLDLSYIKEYTCRIYLHVPLCMGEEFIESEVLYVCIERVPPPSMWLFDDCNVEFSDICFLMHMLFQKE